jgi:hypothetical protein
MNGTSSPAQGVRQLNPQYLSALFMVDGVRREIQALFPPFIVPATVTVTQAQVQGWIRILENAVQLIQSVPVILIFPPPVFVQFANAAVDELNRALQALRSITPPTVLSQTLLGVRNNLRRAELFLLLTLALA